MFYFLLALLILDAFLLMVIVLLQAGKGGGLAAMGGGGGSSDTLLGGRQAATLLTKATWWTGAAFLVLSMILSMMSRGDARTDPLLRSGFQGAPAASAPAPGIGEPTQPTGDQLTPPGAPGVQTAPTDVPAGAPPTENP